MNDYIILAWMLGRYVSFYVISFPQVVDLLQLSHLFLQIIVGKTHGCPWYVYVNHQTWLWESLWAKKYQHGTFATTVDLPWAVDHSGPKTLVVSSISFFMVFPLPGFKWDDPLHESYVSSNLFWSILSRMNHVYNDQTTNHVEAPCFPMNPSIVPSSGVLPLR